jgi:hypothetical protein
MEGRGINLIGLLVFRPMIRGVAWFSRRFPARKLFNLACETGPRERNVAAAIRPPNRPFDSAEWHDQTKRDRLLARLINIVRMRANFAFFSAVDKSAYDEVVPDTWKKNYLLGENHCTFAVRMCLARVRGWREKYGHTDPVQFVFIG